MAPIDSDDAAAVLDELRSRQHRDYDDFLQYELDGHGRLTRLFWADPGVRAASDMYADVVVVDTTFRTNKYGVPFVPFVGLSRHRRPVLLGCGVVADQTAGSYAWLLRAFVLSAGEKTPPQSVITDGCDAMVDAVKAALPLSSHRMCSWHVEWCIREHLGGGGGSTPSLAQNAFRGLMTSDDCSPVEFDERWRDFLAAHRTAKNKEWLCWMYARKELWAAAFVRDKFFLGMAADQRTQCLATALHGGLHDNRMSLLGLLRHVDACAKEMRAREARLDREADASRAELTTDHAYLEEDASRCFTPANFAIVRQEIEAMGELAVVDTMASSSDGSGDKVYTVEDRGGRLVTVLRSPGDAVVECSCRKMEREGLPCGHVLRVLRHERAPSIPECCKLGRMLRRGDARAERLCEMEELGRQVFDLASQDAEEFEEVKALLQGWLPR